MLLKPPDGSREKLQMPKAGPYYIVVEISGDKYSIQDLLTHVWSRYRWQNVGMSGSHERVALTQPN